MKHKTAELEGALLDAAVAKAEGLNPRLVGGACMIPAHEEAEYPGEMLPWPVSSDWGLGGPLIERERITLRADFSTEQLGDWAAMGNGFYAEGPTPLIAAMRAYIDSKFGEEVELP